MSPAARRQVSFVIVFILVVLAFVSTFRMGVVHGLSMYPTYNNGQVVLVRRRDFLSPPLKRNDVVLIKQGNDVIIKRIFRLPGEVVDRTFPDVKDQALQTGLSDYYEQTKVDTPKGVKNVFTVPKGYVVVLGDNLPISEDSRVFGPLPEKNILGVVVASPPPPYLARLGGPGYLAPHGS